MRVRSAGRGSTHDVANRRTEVTRIRATSRNDLLRARAERRQMARTTRQTLVRNRASVRAGVARGQRGTAATEAAASLSLLPPRSAFWTVAGDPQPHRTWAFGGKLAPSARSGTTEDEMLNLIRSHPDGIGIVDLGNELGIDWRELAGPAERLLTHGDIEHIQQLFFPIAG